MMSSPHIISDKNKKSLKIKSILKKKITSVPIEKASFIVIIGGDGFMLQTIKKLYKAKKPFYGINSGNYGFLMNKFFEQKFLKELKSLKMIAIHPLEMIATDFKNKKRIAIGINEISIIRKSKQAAIVSVKNKNKYIIKKLISDGILVSTPAGSTAYNLSVHGPILNLDSKKLAITPISPFRPRRWKGKIVSEKIVIKIKNLDIKKRPVNAVADNYEVRNIKSVIIKINKKIKFNLLYNKHNSLYKKIKIEELKKETSLR
jgi:NAD+ kinase